MAETYRPFSAGDGTDMSESGWSNMARLFAKTGVAQGVENELVVYADSSGMQVKLKSGTALIKGHYYNNSAEAILTITTADGSNDRIDNIVLELDWVNNTITAKVIAGTPAATPAAPTPTQTASVWEVVIAEVLVGTGVSTIASDKVTDKREVVGTGFYDAGELTIASAAITLAPLFGEGIALYDVDTESDAASDTLSTISGGIQGQIIGLKLENASRIVTIDSAGNIVVDTSIVYTSANEIVLLVYMGTSWYVVSAPSSSSGAVFLDVYTGTNQTINSSSEETQRTETITGGTVETGDILEVKAVFLVGNDTGSTRTVRVKVKFGGTTVFDETTTGLSTSTFPEWHIVVRARIRVTGASAQKIVGWMSYGKEAATTQEVQVEDTTSAITVASNADVVLTTQMSTASVNMNCNLVDFQITHIQE